jgi:CBS domain-containing protein
MKASERVNRVMTAAVVWIETDASLEEVLRIFVEQPIHHLPVVKDGAVVGMLSSADIMKLEFFLPPSGPARDRLLRGNFSVRSLMRTPVIVVGENESVERAAELMSKHGIHALPVLGQQDKLVGIITTTDIMTAFLQSSGAITNSNTKAAASDPAGAPAREHLAALEHVAHEAQRYLNAGQDERLHPHSP